MSRQNARRAPIINPFLDEERSAVTPDKTKYEVHQRVQKILFILKCENVKFA